MATTAITPVALVRGTATADLVGAGTLAATPSDGWAISPGDYPYLIFVLEADATGDTVVFTAGDNPPSLHAGRGSVSITLAASDLKVVMVEMSRHLQNDGTIVATCTDTGTLLSAYYAPKGE